MPLSQISGWPGSPSVELDADDLAQQRVVVLAVAVGIAAGSAVAHAHVKRAVRTKGDHAAVVVGKGLVDREDDLLGRRVGRGIGGSR
jgi:hypothetical protein